MFNKCTDLFIRPCDGRQNVQHALRVVGRKPRGGASNGEADCGQGRAGGVAKARLQRVEQGEGTDERETARHGLANHSHDLSTRRCHTQTTRIQTTPEQCCQLTVHDNIVHL
uniref:Uncharacterized protein n=1 Tax=Cacopsylla melanoneura TaxID=428564 RepID=A0A8D8WML3_9HEMI